MPSAARRLTTPSTLSPDARRAFYRALSALLWLLVWQLLAMAVGHEFLLASPLSVLRALARLLSRPDTYGIALRSSGRILLGFLVAFALGAGLAALCHRSPFVSALAAPLLSAARAVPVASFAILAILLVSSRWLSTFVCFVIGFPVLFGNTLEGLNRRDRALGEMARVFGAPPGRRMLYVDLPQLLPYLRSGALTALGLCFKGGVAAEVIGIPRGTIGEALYSVKVNYNTADLFAWTVIIVLLNALAAFLLRRGARALTGRLARL